MTALYWVVDCLATLVECIGCCAFTGIFVEKKNVKKRILVDSTFFSIFIIMMNKISLFSSLNGVMSIVILASLQATVYKRKINNENDSIQNFFCSDSLQIYGFHVIIR